MVELRSAGPWDYVRFVISSLLLLFSLVVTSYAIVEKKTGFWDAVPGWVALLLFVLDMILLGIVEGLQIALVELKRCHPEAYRTSHPAAYRLGQVSAKGDNVERFLMGRQVCVVVLVFFAAKLTTIHADSDGGFLFPVPEWAEVTFMETGLVACVVVVILGQLLPQIVAAKYPVHFMQFVIMRPAYYVCVGIEASGLTHICWVLASAAEKLSRMRDDPTTVNPNEIADAEEALEKIHDALDAEDPAHHELMSPAHPDCNPSADPDEKQQGNGLMMNGQISKLSLLADRVNGHVSPDTLKLIHHYLDTHPERYSQFPAVIGGSVYPAPQAIAQQITGCGHEVPRFLLDVGNPDHVPPHIVACELMIQNRQLREEAEMLRQKLGEV